MGSVVDGDDICWIPNENDDMVVEEKRFDTMIVWGGEPMHVGELIIDDE